MLSVNSINMVKQNPTFRGNGATAPRQGEDDYRYYSKDAYENDKTELEQQLDDVNELIENTAVPKPVRAFGKIVSIGIGVALGFVSMKYGAQGVAKLFRKGAAAVKKFLEKPACLSIKAGVKDLFEGAKDKIVEKGRSIFNSFKQSNAGKKAAEYAEKVKNSEFAGKVKDFGKKVKDSDAMAKAKQYAEDAKAKIKDITSEKVEKGVVNVFAVSGGVTGGISSLKEATKEAE